MSTNEITLYDLLGEEGFTRLVAAFYRQIPNDDILGPMYLSVGPSEEMAAAEGRLRDFLIYRFGGPQRYIEERGHPKLRMRHAPFVVDQAARDRWMELMGNALDEVAFPPQVDGFLRQFLGETATFLINQP